MREMRLIEAIRKFEYASLMTEFETLERERDFRSALMNIKATKAGASAFLINFKITEEGVIVFGTVKASNTPIDLSLLDWSCWLASHINNVALNELSLREVVVFCVDEMTTHGCDLSTVREARLRIRRDRESHNNKYSGVQGERPGPPIREIPHQSTARGWT